MASATEAQPTGVDPQISTAVETQDQSVEQYAMVNDQKLNEEGDAGKKAEADIEVASVDDPTKAYYSKRSVWLMILFSGLAIGSDG